MIAYCIAATASCPVPVKMIERLNPPASNLAELDDLYSPCGAEVEPFPNNGYDEFRGVKRPRLLRMKYLDEFTRSSIPNFYKIFAANALKCESERRRGRLYDAVIRLRPDLELLEPIPAVVLFPSPQLASTAQVVHSSLFMIRATNQVSDKLAVGPSAAMDYYASVWNHLRGCESRHVPSTCCCRDSLRHSLSFTHSLTHARTHALTHSLTHSLTQFLFQLVRPLFRRLEKPLKRPWRTAKALGGFEW
jgi:hypothetical protein